jgi:hypothetical protein
MIMIATARAKSSRTRRMVLLVNERAGARESPVPSRRPLENGSGLPSGIIMRRTLEALGWDNTCGLSVGPAVFICPSASQLLSVSIPPELARCGTFFLAIFAD